MSGNDDLIFEFDEDSPRPRQPEMPPLEDMVEEAREDAFHGMECGYLDRFLPFHHLIRLPFAIDVLLETGSEQGKRRSLEASNEVLIEILRSVAQEGAVSDAVERFRELYAAAYKEAASDRKEHFYKSLLAVLEYYEPDENPILPMLYYEHYIHYLASEGEEDSQLIQAVLAHPRDVEPYGAYAEALRSRGESDAVDRVERMRDEVKAWGK